MTLAEQQPGMSRKALTTSAILHVVILVLATVSFPWLKRDLDIPPPISVELVSIDKVAQTDKQAVKPEAKVPEKKEEKKIDKPPPAPTRTLEKPKPPEPKPEEKKEEVKKEEKVIDELAQPEKKEKKDEKKVEKKEVKKTTPKDDEQDFKKMLINLNKPKDMPTPPPQPDAMPEKNVMTPQGANLPIGARMTMTEEDALRRQLEGCWNPPIGAKDADMLKVDIFMVINPDRTLRSAQIVDTGRYSGDPFFRAMADSAMRAVRSPNCSPFELPPDKYDAWKTATVTFDPSQMF